MLLVRNLDTLRATHSHTGHYMQDTVGAEHEISPTDLSPELSRPFRALRMWLPLMTLGLAPFRAALDEKLLLAQYFHRRVAELGFEVGPEPELSVVIYRWVPPGVDLDAANRFNRALGRRILEDGRLFLSSTTLEGTVWLRAAIVTHRTHLREVHLALAVLGQLAHNAVGQSLNS
jgi:glutamate/tyrosine decarboxylase-like PLP-dependent enzyme